MSTSDTHATPTRKRPSLGVIFLTLYIDLVGFSIIFPLLPSLIQHYLAKDGSHGVLGACVQATETLSRTLGMSDNFAPVLFGGIVGSVFSILQFIFAPIWGRLSDRIGRRPVLVWTVAGTAAGYLLWVFSGSFWLFVLSRVLCGAFGGNLSVATAAVADVTTREERSKAMGLVGAAFGLGLVTGPAIGAIAVKWQVPADTIWEQLGLRDNPVAVPAMIALLMSAVNLLWITRRFGETLPQDVRASTAPRHGNPLTAIFAIEEPHVRRINLVAFVFSTAFVAMEVTLTYLATKRFNYTPSQNGILLGFLGLCSILTQGVLVRRMLSSMPETKVLRIGLILATLGFTLIAIAPSPWVLFVAMAFTAGGSGLVNPSTTGLISLYTAQDDQGRMLGIFRSLGALSRAITPILAGVIFWALGSWILFVVAALCCVLALLLAKPLVRPQN